MFQRFRINLDFNFGRREDKHHTLVGFIQRTTNLMPLPGLIAYIEAERARLRLRPQPEVVSSLEPGIIDFTRPVQPILRGFEQPVFEATATEPVSVYGPPGPTPAQPCALKDVSHRTARLQRARKNHGAKAKVTPVGLILSLGT